GGSHLDVDALRGLRLGRAGGGHQRADGPAGEGADVPGPEEAEGDRRRGPIAGGVGRPDERQRRLEAAAHARPGKRGPRPLVAEKGERGRAHAMPARLTASTEATAASAPRASAAAACAAVSLG